MLNIISLTRTQSIATILTILISCSLMLNACTSAIVNTQDDDIETGVIVLSGDIISHEQVATDGDVWLLETSTGTKYEVFLSIPNLGENYSQYLADVDIGTKIEVSGEIIKISATKRLIAKTLKLL